MSIPWRKLVFASLGLDIALSAHKEFMESLKINEIVKILDVETVREIANYGEIHDLNFMDSLREIIVLIQKEKI